MGGGFLFLPASKTCFVGLEQKSESREILGRKSFGE